MTAWKCPKCNAVMAPFTPMCLYCKPQFNAGLPGVGGAAYYAPNKPSKKNKLSNIVNYLKNAVKKVLKK